MITRELDQLAHAPAGDRHNTLKSAAQNSFGLAVAAGLDAATIARRLAQASTLPADEAADLIAWCRETPYTRALPDLAATAATNAGDDPDLAGFDTVSYAPVDWLIDNWIPAGKVSMLLGAAGLGKSTLLATLIAHITTGQPLQDGTPVQSGTVLLYTPEDGLGDTVKPRLAFAGCDLPRVRALKAPDNLPLLLPACADYLERQIVRYSARLLVVDPLLSMIGITLDAHKSQHIRIALQPLAELAERTGCAIHCLMHPSKSKASDYRAIAGAAAFGELARLVNLLIADPSEPDRRLLVRLKGNLGLPPAGLGFLLESHPDDPNIARVAWDGSTDRTAEQLLDAAVPSEDDRTEVDSAKVSWRCTWPTAPVRRKDIIEAARGEYSRAALDRAARAMRLVTKTINGVRVWAYPP